MDLSKKFLYINPDATSGEEDSAISYPASSLAAIDCTAADTVNLFFKDANMSDTTNVVLTITSGKEKEVIQTIVEAINYSKGANIVIADDSSGEYISSHIASVGVPSLGDSEYNFQGALVSNLGDITATNGNLVVTAADHGIVHTNRGSVTQGTSATTAVTLNTTSGIITTYAATLATNTEVQFTLTNSTIQADSLILVSMNDMNTEATAHLLVTTNTIAGGSCIINIFNCGSGTATATASHVHFLVINNS